MAPTVSGGKWQWVVVAVVGETARRYYYVQILIFSGSGTGKGGAAALAGKWLKLLMILVCHFIVFGAASHFNAFGC